MSFEVIATENFEKKLKRLSKRYRSIRSDLLPIVEQLASKPFLGTPISKDCFKVRVGITSKGRGKSGGARLITYVRYTKRRVFLLDIYDKSEQATLSKKELSWLINLLSPA
ncbi:MAG: type II toxin-antitoxin system RelE/ParE family toxin [Cyclobacteriaceae bacterium]|jgi:mRNA-degrading endonuclease RelE of RelBE toxin-antitoxin system|nr:type II toxin-antitoxin system RelE/ParE family toxin [Cyclobacteriaceae bacterium]